MRTAKFNTSLEKVVKSKKTGRATIRDYKGGRVDVIWGENDKMWKDQIMKIKIGKETAYVNAQDILAVARNI